MRSASSPRSCRPNCYELCKKKEIRPVGSTERIQLTCGLSPQLIETSKQKSGRGRSAGPVFPIERRTNQAAPAARAEVDIPSLVAHFLDKLSDPLQRVRAISDDALRRLMAYDCQAMSANWKTLSNLLWP